jgi:hypothetical protein
MATVQAAIGDSEVVTRLLRLLFATVRVCLGSLVIASCDFYVMVLLAYYYSPADIMPVLY